MNKTVSKDMPGMMKSKQMVKGMTSKKPMDMMQEKDMMQKKDMVKMQNGMTVVMGVKMKPKPAKASKRTKKSM